MPTYIDSAEDFKKMCKTLDSVEALAIDTEFIGERSYYPKLALVQIAAAKNIWLLDPLAVADLSPLGRVMSRSDITVIMHNAESDVPILARACGADFPSLFDTQLAAAFAGQAEQIGLNTLVRRIIGKSLAKGQQVTDWLHRPLSEKQLNYAANDVRYLEQIYYKLRKNLNRSNRLKHYEEEIAVRRERWMNPVDIQVRFKNMFNHGRMTERRHEGLFRLLSWREETAIRKDKPRRHILSDEAVTTLAQQLPKSRAELKSSRKISDRAVKRYGDELIAICREVGKVPDKNMPVEKAPSRMNARTKSLVPAVKLAMEALAREAGIAPGLISRTSDIEELCRAAAVSNKRPDLPCLQGWRGRLVGRKLWRFARGESALRIGVDPNGPAVVFEKLEKK